MATKNRRQTARGPAHLLAAVRCLDNGVVTWTGFARTLNLSENGVLLETPDRFKVDQTLSLEFLLDENRIAAVEGVITRISKIKKMYHVGVAFPKLNAKVKRLLAKQSQSQP